MHTPDLRLSDLIKDELLDDDSVTPIPTEEEIEEAMKGVVDPELMVNAVGPGLLHGVTADKETNVTLDMTLTSSTCSLIDRTEYDMKYTPDGLANSVIINQVWLLSWTLEMITEDGREQLQAIDYNL